MYSASEKLAIIRLVEDSELSIRRTLLEINVSRSSFYRWDRAYEREGPDGLEEALNATGLTQARVHHKPRLLSDNGPCYISKELKEWLQDQNMEHTRGAPYHPMTQGKIER
jgi:transposase InsO family protein